MSKCFKIWTLYIDCFYRTIDWSFRFLWLKFMVMGLRFIPNNGVKMVKFRPVCRIGVGAQSTLGGDIFARKYMHEKITKCPNFTCYLSEKLTQFPNFTWYMPEKITKYPNFTWFLLEKYVSLIFWGKCPLPRLVRLRYAVITGKRCETGHQLLRDTETLIERRKRAFDWNEN